MAFSKSFSLNNPFFDLKYSQHHSFRSQVFSTPPFAISNFLNTTVSDLSTAEVLPFAEVLRRYYLRRCCGGTAEVLIAEVLAEVLRRYYLRRYRGGTTCGGTAEVLLAEVLAEVLRRYYLRRYCGGTAEVLPFAEVLAEALRRYYLRRNCGGTICGGTTAILRRYNLRRCCGGTTCGGTAEVVLAEVLRKYYYLRRHYSAPKIGFKRPWGLVKGPRGRL